MPISSQKAHIAKADSVIDRSLNGANGAAKCDNSKMANEAAANAMAPILH